jgi:hypothetical protein
MDLGITVPLDVARRLNREYAGEAAAETYSSVEVYLRDPAELTRVSGEIRAQGLEIRTSGAEQMGLLVTAITVILTLASVITVIVAALNIAHVFLTLITERRGEIGLMRALGERVDSILRQVREQAGAALDANSLLSADEVIDPRETRRLIEHPFPHWIEHMTVSYLRARGGTAERRGQTWEICWPDGEHTPEAVFGIQEAEQFPTAQHLTLADPRVRDIAGALVPFAAGQPIPLLELSDLPSAVQGLWSLWHIRIETASGRRQRTVPFFLHDDGRTFMPTARRIWDELLMNAITPRGYLPPDGVASVWTHVQQAAEEHARPTYEELLRSWHEQRARSREKAEYTFAARRRAIERIGLAAVRQHRLSLLNEEAETWRRQFATDATVSPELVPLLLVRVEGGRP